MEKTTGPQHFAQAGADFAKPLPANHETIRTLGAMFAILGATLGVNVSKALAEESVTLNFAKIKVEGEGISASQGKLDGNFQKGQLEQRQNATFIKIQNDDLERLGANQIKVDSNFLKLQSVQGKVDSNQLKLDSSPVNGTGGFGGGRLEPTNGTGGQGGGRLTTLPGTGANPSTPPIRQEQNAPIPGIYVVVKKQPAGNLFSVPTGVDGGFEFKGLPAGDYDMAVGGKAVTSFSVGASGQASGRLMKGADGTVSIFDRWGNSMKVADNNSPIPTNRIGVNVAAGDLNGDGRADSRTASSFRIEGHLGRTGDGGAQQSSTAPGGLFTNGNGETGGEKLQTTNGIGGTGGGRYTFKPAAPGFVNVESSNRDHIDQDAQTDIKKTALVNPSTGPGPVPTPQKLEPELLVVIAIIAMKGGGPTVSAPTGPDGTFGFKGLPPGDYELSVGGKVLNSLTVGADGLASGRVVNSPNGLIGLLLPAVQKLAKDSEPEKDKGPAGERFVSRGISGFGSGAGPGGMMPPTPSVRPPGPSPMGAGPMGPGAMGGGAVRR